MTRTRTSALKQSSFPQVTLEGNGLMNQKLNQKPHEMTDACAEVHCWTHNVDEAATGWRVCFECGHVYPSARALRREYRREFWKTSGDSRLGRMPLWARIWRVLTVRASRIDFCQHCLHSF